MHLISEDITRHEQIIQELKALLDQQSIELLKVVKETNITKDGILKTKIIFSEIFLRDFKYFFLYNYLTQRYDKIKSLVELSLMETYQISISPILKV